MTSPPRRGRRAAGARAPRARRRGAAGGAALAALLALAVFAPSLEGGFARDDHDLIGRHAVRTAGPAALPAALASDFHAYSGGGSGKWRPVITLSYAVDGLLGGWRPRAFHLGNLLAHALAAALLVLLIARSGAGAFAAAIAGAWFAVTPAHVEAVSWIAARTDLCAALFLIAALLADHHRRQAGRGSPGFLAPALFALALLCKETMLAALAVFAAAAYATPPAARRAPARRWLLPYALVALLYAAGWAAIGGVPGRPDYIDPDRAAALARGAAWLAPALLGLLLPGVAHAPDWPLPSAASAADPRIWLGLAATLALVAAPLVAARRRSRFAAPLALIAVPLLAPVAAAALQVAGGAVMAERLVYASSAGVAWCAALAAVTLARSGPRGAAARVPLLASALAVIVLESLAARRDQAMYRDDGAIYAAIRDRVPGHALGPAGLATVRMREGRLDEALALLEEAEALDPRLPEIHQARAEIAFAGARWMDAALAAERVIELEPSRGYPRVLAAAARTRMGEGAVMLRIIDSLAATAPGDPMLLAARGEARLEAGRFAEAAADLERALRAEPGDPFTALALARALLPAGEAARAREAALHALALDPQLEEGWVLLAGTAVALGDTAEYEGALARLRALRAAAP